MNTVHTDAKMLSSCLDSSRSGSELGSASISSNLAQELEDCFYWPSHKSSCINHDGSYQVYHHLKICCGSMIFLGIFAAVLFLFIGKKPTKTYLFSETLKINPATSSLVRLWSPVLITTPSFPTRTVQRIYLGM